MAARPINGTTTPRSVMIVGGVILLLIPIVGIASSLFLHVIPYGALIYPLPVLAVIPYLLLATFVGPMPAFVAIFVPTILFWVWGMHLFQGASAVPRRSIVLFWTLVVLTVAYFVVSWELGVRYQGYFHLLGVVLLNLFAVYVLWRLLLDAIRGPSFQRNFVFHWSLFAWLAWFAFPILGEMP